jgi:hypothetical protein
VVSAVEDHRVLFGESAGRVVLCTSRAGEVLSLAAEAGVTATVIGDAGGERIVVHGLVDVMVADATAAWRAALPEALGEPVSG